MSGNEYAQIGWIGLGQMGNLMATRLLDANIEVGVYSRSPDRTVDLQTKGAKACPSSTEPTRVYPVTSLMVSDYATVLDILSEDIRKESDDKITVNMSTTASSKNLIIKIIVEAADGQFAEVPVPGSVGPATNGVLLILFGGERNVLNPLQKVFGTLGKKALHFGSVGKGPGTRLIFSSFLGIFGEAYSEVMLMMQQFGINTDTTIEAVGGSAMDSLMFQTKKSLWVDCESPPAFTLEHAPKNFNLAVNELRQAGNSLSTIETVVGSYREVARARCGGQDAIGAHLNLVKE